MDPKTRPRLRALEYSANGGSLALRDPLDGRVFPLAVHEALALSFMDGRRTAAEISGLVARRLNAPPAAAKLLEFLARLSAARLLEDAAGQAHERAIHDRILAEPRRPATHAGAVYPADAEECASFVDAMLAVDPTPVPTPGPLAMLSPHIDYARGAEVYGRLWSGLRDQLEDVSRVVILGTSHYGGGSPFLFTRKAFFTPLGEMPVDQELVELLIEACGAPTLADELIHRQEHAIELQLPLLQRCLPRPDLPILPILCGTFHAALREGQRPEELARNQEAIGALREVLGAVGGRTLWIAAGDLAHVGAQFGDPPDPLSDAQLRAIHRRDHDLLETLVRGDADALTDHLLEDGDARRICGYGPLWVLLSAAGPLAGELVSYAQALDERRSLLVSFAGLLFHPRSD